MSQVWIEKIISLFNPHWALDRARARRGLELLTSLNFDAPAWDSGGYEKRSLSNWAPRLTSANTELSAIQRQTIVARAYDAYRNQEIARAAITRVKTSVVGLGLRLNPALDGDRLRLTEEEVDELEDTIEREFAIFAQNCDIERILDFDQLQALVLITALITGDCFINTPILSRPGDLYGLKIQVIDGERISNPGFQSDRPGLIRGIELDNFGAPIAYNALRSHPAAFPEGSYVWDRLFVFGEETGRRRLLHFFDKERPEQVRGVSYLAPILDSLKQLKRYTEAELMAAILGGLLTIFIESPGIEENYGFKNSQTDTKGNSLADMGYGAIINIEKGKHINLVNPTRPNVSFEPFTLAIMRQIAAALEIPLDEVLLKFDTSFSAARAAMLKAWLFYRTRRKLLTEVFCQPVYSLWFDEAVSRGFLPYIRNYGNPRVRLAYQQAAWLGTGRGAIDEQAEAEAARIRIGAGISSIPIEAAQLTGENWEKIAKQQAKALRTMEKLGLTPVFSKSQPSLRTVKEEGEE